MVTRNAYLALVLALLALAIHGASATYHKNGGPRTVNHYKWRCLVPGCSTCAAYKPHQCTACGTGYTLMPDATCGAHLPAWCLLTRADYTPG